jgi:CPA2 family monovalent cation:H+ antiporter-2
MPHALLLLLALLAAAVVVVVVCRLAHLPPILGYLGVGNRARRAWLAWVPLDDTTRAAGEFGVVFLMFSVGLEFSLPQLRAMRRAVFGLGVAQVAATTIGSMIALHFLGYGWQAGLVLGGALAMSSTAIVSKMLAERMELGTMHGRDVMAVLLFQDLAVVAFLIVIPSLSQSGAEMATSLSLAALKAAIALAVILFVGQRPMRAWFHLVARQRSSELFVLNVLLVTLGLGALTESLGLSLALGAFLAGMLIAETEYRYQVEEDIKPFRDVLLGLFFVIVGMALDLRRGANFGWVLLLSCAGRVQAARDRRAARALRRAARDALRTGFYLAQAGELALVMLALAVRNASSARRSCSPCSRR